MPSENTYLSIDDAASLLRVHPQTIVRWIDTQVLMAKTVGDHQQVLRQSLNGLLQEIERLPIIDPVAPDVIKIAIVEDDLDLTKLLEMTIHSFHFKTQVQTVSNGLQGLALLSEYSPDIVIADLNMPVLDGFTMLRALEDTPLAPKRVIVTTALSLEDIALRGGIPAKAKLIRKPFALTELEALISPAA